MTNGLPVLVHRVQQPALRRDYQTTAKLSPLHCVPGGSPVKNCSF